MTETFQGRLFPKEAAEAIGIAPTTLRKYSQIIEESTSDENFFERTDQNVRTYNHQNILLFQEIKKLSDDTKKPIKNIIEKMIDDEKYASYFEKDTQAIVPKEAISVNPSTQELLAIIDQQSKKIDQLIQVMTAFTMDVRKEFQEVKPMIQQSQHLISDNSEQTMAETKQLQENVATIQKETHLLKEQQEKMIEQQKRLEEETKKQADLAKKAEEARQKVEAERKELEQMKADWEAKKAKEKEEQEQIAAEKKALGNSPFETQSTTAETTKTEEEAKTEEPKEEKKPGFFQRLFGKK